MNSLDCFKLFDSIDGHTHRLLPEGYFMEEQVPHLFANPAERFVFAVHGLMTVDSDWPGLKAYMDWVGVTAVVLP